MRIVVVGGSIGGLAAAIALRNTNPGAEVCVLERRKSMDDEGAGLALRPEALDGLRSLGITIDGTPIRAWRYAAVADGQVRVRAQWNAPLTAYSYGAVRSALIARASGIELRTGANVSAVGGGDESAWVRVDGTVLDVDLVVGGDGVDSITRRTLFPDVRASAMDIAMWRGFAHENEARAIFGGDVLESFHNVNTQVFASSAKGWWLGILVPERTPGAGRRFVWLCYMRGMDATKTGLREQLEASFPAPIASLTDIGMVSAQRVTKLVVPAMARGRVCLIGDAAHVVPPFTTAGATLAIADGVQLARTIAGAAVTNAALEAWSAERINAVHAIHAQADAIARHTIDHPPALATASADALAAWARGFLPPPSAQALQLVDHPLWRVAGR